MRSIADMSDMSDNPRCDKSIFLYILKCDKPIFLYIPDVSKLT